MFDYTLPNGLPSGSRTAWSQRPLRPLASTPLTPFSYSVLAEIAGRAWYQYFDKLGFDPMPRARVLRQHQGRPYLNLTISAQRDAEGAAIEPPVLRLDGQPFPLCKWEKPGLLAGLKASLAQNRVETLLKNLAAEMNSISQQAQAWDTKTLESRWAQAEVLQIMEEIENIGVRSFIPFLAARHNLDLIYNRLIRLTIERSGYPANLALIDAATGDNTGLIEQAIIDELCNLGVTVAKDQATVDWLRAGVYENWEQTLPNQTLVSAVQEFLALYGHRCAEEGEIRHARWRQELTPVFTGILAATQDQTRPMPYPTNTEAIQTLLAAIDSGRRKEAQQLAQKVHPLRQLQSQALHAFAYILAGTQRWALAAAREAMVDQRLLAADDVFFFELEEIKEMMTGEWNVSHRSEIQRTCARRKAEFAQWQQASPPELLIGESETLPQQTELPLSFTLGLGQLYRNLVERERSAGLVMPA